jgi:hypothetical protein
MIIIEDCPFQGWCIKDVLLRIPESDGYNPASKRKALP